MGIRYVKVVGTPLYNFTCQLVADLPVEAQMCKLSMRDPGPSAPQFGLNQQVSGVSDILPIPHCQGAVLEYILQDPLVKAGGLYRVSERGRLTHEASIQENYNAYGSDYGSEAGSWIDQYLGYPAVDESE